jgi:nucleotide-binding universal stress UspA family protein
MTTQAKPANKPYRIVVGFDFTDLSERAVKEALGIARRHAPAELHVVTAALPAGLLMSLPGEWQGRLARPAPSEAISEELARETVRRRLVRVIDEDQVRRGPVGLERIAFYVLSPVPVEEPGKLIADLAAAVQADLIVVGTHGRKGLARALLGSVAAQVVREANTSVYVVRPADFVRGEKVPERERPLAAGEPHLKHFEHRRTYHYVDKVAAQPSGTMPAS